jgi:peptide-methionine (S)-S-oxide reductase
MVKMIEKATFGAGCFWHVEESFRHVNGVELTIVGYMGGNLKNPTYENVCSNETEHAEVVQLEYDPKKVSYKELLENFWKIHDPTTLNRQGPDVGTQYRSIIFYHNQKQKNEAIKSRKEQQNIHSKNIVTEIIPASKFWKAEEYHQRYLEKHRLNTCRI